MNDQGTSLRRLRPVALVALLLVAGSHGGGTAVLAAGARGETTIRDYYGSSYAVVVGVSDYESDRWKNLSYARHDAEAVASLLERLGFEVRRLLDSDATRAEIVSALQVDLPRRVTREDRVLVFFAGHGYTERLGDRDWGYIVPHDASSTSDTFISMEELRAFAGKLGRAKHLLFVMDACYGGLLGVRAGAIAPEVPNYIEEITSRSARQILTAGGRDQVVLDGGGGGKSLFAAAFLDGIEEGHADLNGDGFVTFPELQSYVVPRASNEYQTPTAASLPEHGLGEFVFRSLGRRGETTVPPAPRRAEAERLRGPESLITEDVSSGPKNVTTRHEIAPAERDPAFGIALFIRELRKQGRILSGLVTDVNGDVLPGVRVTLAGPTSSSGTVAYSNASGMFRFQAHSTGDHRITAELEGFRTLSLEARLGISSVEVVRQTSKP